MKWWRRAVAALFLGGAALPAQACILCSCSASTQSVAFGTYNPLSGTTANGTGRVQLNCTGTLLTTLSFQVALGPGLYGGSVLTRQMANGTNRLGYQLYGPVSGNPCGGLWGDGSSGLGVLTGSITFSLLGLAFLDQAVCGVVPANQTSAGVGTYTDTVSVVVTYN